MVLVTYEHHILRLLNIASWGIHKLQRLLKVTHRDQEEDLTATL